MKKRITAGVVLFLAVASVWLWLQWKKDAPRRLSFTTLEHLRTALNSPSGNSLLEIIALPQALQSRTPGEQIEFITKALRDEISPEGLDVLRKRGAFGPLKQLFPQEAEGWAKQAEANPDDCVAFKLEQNGLRTEVVLVRDSAIRHPPSPYRIVRCNNVKPLASAKL